MPGPLTLKMLDGSQAIIDRAEWPPLAGLTLSQQLGHVVQKLVLAKHADGRLLVYGVVDADSRLSTLGSFTTPDKAAADLRQIAIELGLAEYLLNQCLARLGGA